MGDKVLTQCQDLNELWKLRDGGSDFRDIRHMNREVSRCPILKTTPCHTLSAAPRSKTQDSCPPSFNESLQTINNDQGWTNILEPRGTAGHASHSSVGIYGVRKPQLRAHCRIEYARTNFYCDISHCLPLRPHGAAPLIPRTG